MRDRGIAYRTISNDKRSLKAAFYIAIQDDCICKNPFDLQLNTVLEDTTEPKVPLTPAQEESLLAFVESDSVKETGHYIEKPKPQSVAVYYGTLQYHYDTELLRTRNLRFRKG